jgi:Fic family protein
MARLCKGFPLRNRLRREMHAHLMARGRCSDKAPGEFHRSQNWIGGTRPGNARFVPPPQAIEPCMSALEQVIHSKKPGRAQVIAAEDKTAPEMPALFKAALAHVQFETIHPFLDDNGRPGHLLIALLLHQGGVISHPLL